MMLSMTETDYENWRDGLRCGGQEEYDPSVVRMAHWVPPIRFGRNAEEWFHSTMHRAYVQSFFLKYAEPRIA